MRLSRGFHQFCLITTCLGLPSAVFAGAWTNEPDEWRIISTFSAYSTDSYHDAEGDKQTQPTYRKLEWNPYLEYGLREGTTIGFGSYGQQLEQDGSSNLALADTEIFLKQRLWQSGSWIFTAQPLIKLPSIEEHERRPRGGSDEMDAELALMTGYGFDLLGRHHYLDMGAAYRHRFESPGDQYKLSGTMGLQIWENWQIMPQLFLTMRTKDSDMPAFTQSTGDDYDLLKGQLSVVYTWDERTAIQLGGFQHLYSRNTGDGGGMLFSVWTHF